MNSQPDRRRLAIGSPMRQISPQKVSPATDGPRRAPGTLARPAAAQRQQLAPLSWPVAGVVIGALVAIATGLLIQDYRAVNAAGAERAAALSQIAATYVQQTLAAVDAGLQDLTPDPTGAVSRPVPMVQDLKVIGGTGQLLPAADAVPGSDLPADAAYRFHRDHAGTAIRLGAVDRAGMVQISRRLETVDGRFAGVVIGRLDTDGFTRFFAALGVDTVELVGADGAVLVRFPPELPAGTAPLAQEGDDTHFVAFHALSDLPLTIGVGIDRRDYLSAWESKRNVAVALVAALIALVVGAMLAVRKHTENAVALVALTTRSRTEAVARQQADELSKRKSDFLSQMSHELRTPLNAIIGFSEVIKGAAFGPVGQPKYQEYADDIHFSAQHLLSVINNILDLSKVESGKWQIADEDIALPDLFDALMRLAGQRAARENVQIAVRSCPDVVVRGDQRTLLQIMLNLTVNAIKFAGPNRLVDLDVTPMLDGGLEISVADYGDGMTKADIAKAMRPFDAPTSHINRKKQDTGLGLPLAAAFAELHGGEVVLDSAPGIGTTARLRLPASRVQPFAA